MDSGYLPGNAIILHELQPERCEGNFKYEIVDGRHRFHALKELGYTTCEAQIFPVETSEDMLNQVGYAENNATMKAITPTFFDQLCCIRNVKSLLDKRGERSSHAQISNFVGRFNKAMSRGQVSHLSVILNYGDEVLKIIEEDIDRLQDSHINMSTAYGRGQISKALNIDASRDVEPTPEENERATKYFSLLRDSQAKVTGSAALNLAQQIPGRYQKQRYLRSVKDELSEQDFNKLLHEIWVGFYDDHRDFDVVVSRFRRSVGAGDDHATGAGHRPELESTERRWQFEMANFFEFPIQGPGKFDCNPLIWF